MSLLSSLLILSALHSYEVRSKHLAKYPGCQRSTRSPSRRPAEGWKNERTARSERSERSAGRE